MSWNCSQILVTPVAIAVLAKLKQHHVVCFQMMVSKTFFWFSDFTGRHTHTQCPCWPGIELHNLGSLAHTSQNTPCPLWKGASSRQTLYQDMGCPKSSVPTQRKPFLCMNEGVWFKTRTWCLEKMTQSLHPLRRAKRLAAESVRERVKDCT